jgi:hypothetical protein
VADDIFEKIWSQLGRIYVAVHDGLIPRADDGSRQPVTAAIRQTFGLQDTGRLSDTAAMDLRDEADAIRNEQAAETRIDFRPAVERIGNSASVPSVDSQSIGDEIRQAVSEIGPAITGAISESQQPSGGAGSISGDDIKGTQLTEHQARVEALLDRIADGIDRLGEFSGTQKEATSQLIDELKTGSVIIDEIVALAKTAINALAILTQLQSGQKNEDVKNAQKVGANILFGTVTGTGAKLFP